MDDDIEEHYEGLSEAELQELADILALHLHSQLGSRVYQLNRTDVAELLEPYTADLLDDDHQALPWLVWHLFQEALEIEMGHGR
ncbi:MAG: hypothetical protein HC837_10815 [Chloroflexaceae bacterium]|nr:hypothetical protein [Chloroflexaceae bacterium]